MPTDPRRGAAHSPTSGPGAGGQPRNTQHTLAGAVVLDTVGQGGALCRWHHAEDHLSLDPPPRMLRCLQCGFCTPGFVMSMYALLRTKAGSEAPSEEEIEDALGGNLW